AVTAVITLLGITGIIKTIKERYLNALFTALILEVIAAVFLLFRSNFGAPIDLAAIIADAKLNPPETVELQEEFIVDRLSVFPTIQPLNNQVDSLEKELSEKLAEIADLKGSISRYDQNFYSNIIRLDDELYKIRGKTINLGYKAEEKEEVYKYLVNIFQDLGIIKEGDEVFRPNGKIDKIKVRNIYKQFRASYGRPVTDDTKVYIEAFDISRMVGRYLEYRKVTPQFQARFNALNN
ncbi:MAG: hypothetical protein AAGJ18_23735, partial [Bacteroidota bacterium]